jgi:hypothetical protein
MKLLRLGRGASFNERLEDRVAIRVLRGSVVTGYLEERSPVLCVGEVKHSFTKKKTEAILIPVTTGIDGVLKFPSSAEDLYLGTGAVFAGLIEATDEGIDVLRQAGYRVRDLRNVRLADFLKGLE